MTSQEETNIDALKAEAKELGVAGWQAMKNPEKLQAKIDEAKKGTVRKKAPMMQVTTYAYPTACTTALVAVSLRPTVFPLISRAKESPSGKSAGVLES